MKTAVFSRFLARFCAEKVLRWLAQTSLLESNVQLPEIGIHTPTTGRWMLDSRNPASNNLGMETRVPSFSSRNLVFNIHLVDGGLQLPTSNIWMLEGGTWESHSHLLRFQVLYKFLPGGSFEPAGCPHVFLVGGKEWWNGRAKKYATGGIMH